MKQELYIEQALEWFDFWSSNYIKKVAFKGFSISVAKDDEVIFSKAYGINGDVDLADTDMFRMASHSKNITAIAIMKLVEEEKLMLDDKVIKHIEFLNSKDKGFQTITVRQLLNHSAGIKRDGYDSSFWSLNIDFPSVEELKSTFLKSKTYCETNTRLKYSNLGYGLLGLIIEKVTGQKYNDYIHEHILNGYDMFMDSDFIDNSKIAKGYTCKHLTGKIEELDTTVSTNALSSATGLTSSTKEMAMFYQKLCMGDQSLITDESKKELFKPNFDINKEYKVKYGLGFRNKTYKGFKQIGHTGGFPGHQTVTAVDVDKKISISCAINCIEGNPVAILNTLIEFINKFESKKDSLLINSNFDYKKVMLCLWGESVFVPFKDEISEIGIYTYTFSESNTISKNKDSSYQFTKCGNLDSYNEPVEFLFDENNIIKTVNRAGVEMTRREDFKMP